MSAVLVLLVVLVLTMGAEVFVLFVVLRPSSFMRRVYSSKK